MIISAVSSIIGQVSSGRNQFYLRRRYWFRLVFSAGDELWAKLQVRLSGGFPPTRRSRVSTCKRLTDDGGHYGSKLLNVHGYSKHLN